MDAAVDCDVTLYIVTLFGCFGYGIPYKEVDVMGINIRAKSDTSYLFAGLNSGNGNNSGLSNILSDYASIKNGSYGKLMKAYYSKDANDNIKSVASQNNVNKTSKRTTSSLSADETKAYTDVQSSTDELTKSADKLQARGSKSVFSKKDITTKDENGVESTVKGYDKEAIYSAVNDFVKNYNSVVKAAGEVDNNSIDNRVSSMENSTRVNKKSLSSLGITINDDSTLSIDKDKFMAGSMDTAKNLFNGTGSYGYSVSVSAAMINSNADYALSKASTYDTNGNFSNAYNTGNLFSNYF